MARYIFLSGNIINNIVESGNGTPSVPFGTDTVTLALTGTESVGDDISTILVYVKVAKQAALDAFLNANFDLLSFIRNGTSTLVTGVGVGTFLATITDNYRTIRANIAAAGTVNAVNAININSGWPNNP